MTKHGIPAMWLEEHKDFKGSECLTWPFSCARGYAIMWWNGRMARVNRILCERRHGPPPTPEHQAAHSCGRGKFGCVNQQHLDWETCAENHADKLRHGTSNRGARHGLSKLTENEVLEIRAATGIVQQELADKYGVSRRLIGMIKNRDRWVWL